MVSSKDCFKKYGDPTQKETQYRHLEIWDVPAKLEIGFIPKRIYCNRDLIKPLQAAFENLIETGCVDEIVTWDGCWNVRAIRGYEKSRPVKYSLHSWAIAVDINAATNGLGRKPTFSKKFVKCFKDAGFDWGGDFTRQDGMHFQLKTLYPAQEYYKMQLKPVRHWYVKAIQEALVNVGFKLVVDGLFGLNTDKAVRDFQLNKGLKVDGVVGPNTSKVLGLM